MHPGVLGPDGESADASDVMAAYGLPENLLHGFRFWWSTAGESQERQGLLERRFPTHSCCRFAGRIINVDCGKFRLIFLRLAVSTRKFQRYGASYSSGFPSEDILASWLADCTDKIETTELRPLLVEVLEFFLFPKMLLTCRWFPKDVL